MHTTPQPPSNYQSNQQLISELAVLKMIDETLLRMVALSEELECPLLVDTAVHLAEHQAAIQARMAGMI